MFSIQRPSIESPTREKISSDANRKKIQDFYKDQQGRMTSCLDKTTFLREYLAYPEPPPQSSAPHSPQHRSQSHADNTGNIAPLPEHILERLQCEGKYDGNAWVGLPKNGKEGIEEKGMYGVLMGIFERIASLTGEYYSTIDGMERIPGKWFDTSKKSLHSWSRNAVPDLKPDLLFAREEATSAAEMFWSRTFSVIEVKRETVADSGVEAQLNSYVTHIFAEQVDRLFVNAITLRGWELQVYRFDRSGIVSMQEKINIHESPKEFIQVIASFSYLSPRNLGWDPTCKVWDSEKGIPRPSYELSQNTFKGHGVYDIPWVFQVGDEDFVAIKAVNARRQLSIWGRASFVVYAVKLADWQIGNTKAKAYILKQCWQRLPGLGPEPKTAELQNADHAATDQPNREKLIKEFQDIDRKPFEETVMERAGWMDRLEKSSMVEVNGKPITTFDTIRKNHATHAQAYKGKRTVRDRLDAQRKRGTSSGARTSTKTGKSTRAKTSTKTGKSIRTGTSASSTPAYTMQDAPDHPTLVTRTLVRLVFDRPGWPIERFRSKKELLNSLKSIVQELGILYENGVIHRDVSPSNLIISDSGGHIIDFDHSKIAFQQVGVKTVEHTEDKEVIAIATDLFEGDKRKARLYVYQLKELWGVEGGTVTPADFNWPDQIGSVYAFGSRERRDGFLTGTYQYMSHDLKTAPFHHGGHDLDSLFWSVNTLPLKYEGPGGKKRQNPPVKIINKYCHGGPSEKKDLMFNFSTSGGRLREMMSGYSDYFKDLTDFMERWYLFLLIALGFRGYEYYHPHPFLIKIIDEAIKGLGSDAEEGYADDVKKEEKRREKDKEDMEGAISKRMTVGALLKERGLGTVSVSNAASPTIPASATHNTPPRASIPLTIQIPTAQSPETGRVVKKSRAGSPTLEE